MIKKIFSEKSNIPIEKINSIKKISSGFSNNDNYLVVVGTQKYQFRIPKQKIDHKSELSIYKKYFKNQIIYIDSEGLLIKKWIDGNKPNMSNDKVRTMCLNEISKFHKLEAPKELGTFGFRVYEEQYSSISPNLLKEFKETMKILESEPKSLIHGDINIDNMVHGDGIYLIDFEWVSLGPSIIDYVYLLTFTDFPIEEISEFTKRSIKDLKLFRRFILIHTILWCLKQKTKKSLKLQTACFQKLDN